MTLEYWKDGKIFVGRLREYPNVFSQGRSVKALEANIRDAMAFMIEMKLAPITAPKPKEQGSI